MGDPIKMNPLYKVNSTGDIIINSIDRQNNKPLFDIAESSNTVCKDSLLIGTEIADFLEKMPFANSLKNNAFEIYHTKKDNNGNLTELAMMLDKKDMQMFYEIKDNKPVKLTLKLQNGSVQVIDFKNKKATNTLADGQTIKSIPSKKVISVYTELLKKTIDHYELDGQNNKGLFELLYKKIKSYFN